MRSPYELDKTLGLEYFVTSARGVGGKLRYRPQDFYVEEIPLPTQENGEYVHFTLEKVNWDTMSAIQALAKAVGTHVRRFGYAGNKDKRAHTVQRVSAHGVEAERLRAVGLPGIELRDFVYASSPIRLGDLMGNRFRIVARLIEGDVEEVRSRLLELRREMGERGVPNYFGYQRFGVIRANTHLVGKELVKGRIREAVMTYLGSPFPGEKEDAREARAYLDETLDYEGSLERFPRRLRYERAMLKHLIRNPRDFAGALRRLPKKLGMLLVHAYQGYLFNRVLSRAIEEGVALRGLRIPLFGYDTHPGEGPLGELEREVLAEEGITPKSFWIRSVPEYSTRGFMREACIEPEVGLEVGGDELNPGRTSFTADFALPKGSYATVVMREYMKTDPLNY
jgi:tRNA pseudouridine13 synthase